MTEVAMRALLRSYAQRLGFATRCFEAVNPERSEEKRIFLKIETDEGWCFVDHLVWSGPFVIEDLFEEPMIDGVGPLPSSDHSNHGTAGLAGSWFFNGGVLPDVPLDKEGVVNGEATRRSRSELANPTPWQAFLLTRSDHVFVKKVFDEGLYQRLLDAYSFKGLTRNVVERLAKNIHIGEESTVACEPWPPSSFDSG